MTPADLAHKLALARGRGCIATLDPSDTIADVDEAYRVQAELAALQRDGVRGWKVTALTAPEQKKFSSSRPVAGALLGQYVHAEPTSLPLSNMILPLLECEVAFTLATDLPAQPHLINSPTSRRRLRISSPLSKLPTAACRRTHPTF